MISTEELLKVYKLKNLIRYNTRTKISKENVAEHSFYVALMSLLISDKLDLTIEEKYNILAKSILHDLSEMELNDITHDVKEKLNLRPLLEEYENNYYKVNFPSFYKLMSNNKNNIINRVVNLADAYSVKQYVENEKLLGNFSNDIKEINVEIDNRIKELEKRLKIDE